MQSNVVISVAVVTPFMIFVKKFVTKSLKILCEVNETEDWETTGKLTLSWSFSTN